MHEPVAAAILSLAVEPITKADEEKLRQGLRKLMAEDPTIRPQTRQATGHVVITGTSELHLEIHRRPAVTFVTAPRTEPFGKVAVFVDIAGNRWDLLGPRIAVAG